MTLAERALHDHIMGEHTVKQLRAVFDAALNAVYKPADICGETVPAAEAFLKTRPEFYEARFDLYLRSIDLQGPCPVCKA